MIFDEILNATYKYATCSAAEQNVKTPKLDEATIWNFSRSTSRSWQNSERAFIQQSLHFSLALELDVEFSKPPNL